MKKYLLLSMFLSLNLISAAQAQEDPTVEKLAATGTCVSNDRVFEIQYEDFDLLRLSDREIVGSASKFTLKNTKTGAKESGTMRQRDWSRPMGYYFADGRARTLMNFKKKSADGSLQSFSARCNSRLAEPLAAKVATISKKVTLKLPAGIMEYDSKYKMSLLSFVDRATYGPTTPEMGLGESKPFCTITSLLPPFSFVRANPAFEITLTQDTQSKDLVFWGATGGEWYTVSCMIQIVTEKGVWGDVSDFRSLTAYSAKDLVAVLQTAFPQEVLRIY